jgi:hypothetical protein
MSCTKKKELRIQKETLWSCAEILRLSWVDSELSCSLIFCPCVARKTKRGPESPTSHLNHPPPSPAFRLVAMAAAATISAPPLPPFLLRPPPNARAPLPPRPPRPAPHHRPCRPAGRGRLDPRPRLRRRSRHRGRLRLPRRRRPVRRCRAGGFVRRAGSVPPGPRARRGRGVQAGVHGRRFCPRRGTAVRVPRQVRAGDHGGATLRAPRRGRRRARSCHGEGVPHQQDHTARRRPDRARLCRRDGDQVSSRFSTECSVVCTCWNRTYRIFAASR